MLRTLVSKSTSAVSIAQTQKRSFHSPFTVLPRTQRPSKTPSSSTPQYARATDAYEKHFDASADPHGLAGARVHVVSSPDPAYQPYTVPIGAYPVSTPYSN
ncbi:hypothetical protein DFH11DRAFT_1734034 [Phellopilus nigrolimitatus]|nr:hypothetical protein DFH11DRAFT_1734034 [Phellopilus nigrolimitatus]